MKKKIKDLREEQRDTICHKYQNNHLCRGCPLLYNKVCIAEALESEVEVDE